jgi:hypothetical protein
MPGFLRARLADAYGLVAHSLSGRLLLLTVLYVMVAEILIFVPSVGRYHRELLDNHIQSAELAVFPLVEPGGDRLPGEVQGALLERAGASQVLLTSPDRRQLFEVMPPPSI